MFKSVLSSEISDFLDMRSCTVAKSTYEYDVFVLTTLDSHLIKKNYCSKILDENVVNSLIQSFTGSSKTVMNKVTVIRNFTKYLNTSGNLSFIPHPPKVKSEYIPYIYSQKELELIFYYADNLPMKSPLACNPYLPVMIPMVLRILYGCGTRLEETMSLQRKDINFTANTIFLKHTKLSKERLIPMHETLSTVLKKYCSFLRIMDKTNAYLFPSTVLQDNHFSGNEVLYWFNVILKAANIAQGDSARKQRGANLHSFRHVFVLNSMLQMEKLGHSVDMNDLLLPTYLGHKCLIDTDQYMRFSGLNTPEFEDVFNDFTKDIIPKLEVHYIEE